MIKVLRHALQGTVSTKKKSLNSLFVLNEYSLRYELLTDENLKKCETKT